MTIQSYAAKKPKGHLEKFDYDPQTLGPKDIEVQISHCGICHSDIHLIDDDWGLSQYPLVPGHEIVGNIIQVGPEVTSLQKGQRVGIGWQRSACLECEFCVRGDENLCAKAEATCVGHFGGFAQCIRTDSRFAFPIPETLESENAAPLMCAGITVYSPLRAFNVLPHMRVGVIGVGGLGHLAVQFARAYGCEVTAFSHTPSKVGEAKKFGAHHFVSLADAADLEKQKGSLDFIISTAYKDLNWGVFLETLRPDGKLCFVGIPGKPLEIPLFSLLGGRKSICASPIGPRRFMTEMLDFAARHKITAKTESAPLEEAQAAVQKVRTGEARYRIVLNI